MANNNNSLPTLSEYRVMYLFGAWVTSDVICAESDAEAIFDANESAARLMNWPYRVALFCGNRIVKNYK